jgi:hypothetical protein
MVVSVDAEGSYIIPQHTGSKVLVVVHDREDHEPA